MQSIELHVTEDTNLLACLNHHLPLQWAHTAQYHVLYSVLHIQYADIYHLNNPPTEEHYVWSFIGNQNLEHDIICMLKMIP